jgi:Flp pilus assembly protein TadD
LLQPKNVDYQSTLGKIAIRLRKLDAADQAFRTAIDLGLQDATIYSQLAEIQLVDCRNVPKAIRLAKLAVELQPTAKNYHVLATANWHAGDNLAASTALREAIRLEPENVEYRDTLAFLESNK